MGRTLLRYLRRTSRVGGTARHPGEEGMMCHAGTQQPKVGGIERVDVGFGQAGWRCIVLQTVVARTGLTEAGREGITCRQTDRRTDRCIMQTESDRRGARGGLVKRSLSRETAEIRREDDEGRGPMGWTSKRERGKKKGTHVDIVEP